MAKTTNESLNYEKGSRLYLTEDEREAFLLAAKNSDRQTRTFCQTPDTTGCRISEALCLQPRNLDFGYKVIVFESLKKRKKGVFRAVPVPDDYLDTLNLVHGLKELYRRKKNLEQPLWNWSRMTGYRKVMAVMEAAGIQEGPHRCPKGLRHGYGVNAILNKVPLNTLKKWMGHSKIETTAIYADAVGEEERAIAARMW